MTDDAETTMKPVYEFEWTNGRTRRTDSLENDCPEFGEAGLELLAEFGRDDPECTVTLVGLVERRST